MTRLRACHIADTAAGDISKVSSSVKSELPGKKDEVKGDAKVFAADAGKKLDDWTKDAKAGLSKADAKLEQYRTSASQNIDATLKDARREANAAVDKFDKNVTEVSIEEGDVQTDH